MNAMMVEKTALAEAQAREDALGEPPRREGTGSPADFLTSGLDLFIHVLRHPEELFGTPSQEPAVNRYPSDPAHLAQGLRRYFAWSNKRCMDAYARMRMGAGLARVMDLRICSGPLEVHLLEDPSDGSLSLTVNVSVDAGEDRVCELNETLLRLATDCCVYSACLNLEFYSIHALRIRESRRREWARISAEAADQQIPDDSGDD